MSSVRTAALAAFALCATLAQAQVYRIVGPDGKVVFTDRPPVDAKASQAPTVAIGDGAASGNLPAELRKVAGQYPVTLYSGNDCAPCTSARTFLRGRGIPFIEKTVNSDEDAAALQRVSGANSLPFATIGGQHLRGFSDIEWSQYLDAAGYPKSSVLPASYRNPPASPLVVAQQPAARPAAAAASQAQAAPTAPAPVQAPGTSGANPAGIRF